MDIEIGPIKKNIGCREEERDYHLNWSGLFTYLMCRLDARVSIPGVE